jgi:cytochrome c-type biogenesis protein CcmH
MPAVVSIAAVSSHRMLHVRADSSPAPVRDMTNNKFATPEDILREARAQHLFRQIRCLVCANQTVESSETEFSINMRHLVRVKIAEGMTDEEVKAFLIKGFGPKVLYTDMFTPESFFLYAAPFLIFGAIAVGIRAMRRSSSAAAPKL